MIVGLSAPGGSKIGGEIRELGGGSPGGGGSEIRGGFRRIRGEKGHNPVDLGGSGILIIG